jgi:hypothetical protein
LRWSLAIASLQLAQNLIQDCIRFFQDLIVPEAQHQESAASHIRGPLSVRFDLLQMLPAVELDHEPPFKATEVCDIPPDSILASEFCAKLAAAQSHPELQLGPGLIAPQLPRAIE